MNEKRKSVFPCAKINLGLNVVKKREDGYHDLETVFYPVDIHDRLEIALREDGTRETVGDVVFRAEGNPIEGTADQNLVVKAYRLLAESHALPPVDITLEKRIPMQAGMGGGSSDGAFAIRLLNDLCRLNMSNDEMQRTAARLGADCAFFIKAQPAYAEGIGERLSPLALDLSDYKMVVVKPPVAVSTREAFAGIKPKRPVKNCREIVMQPMETWRELLVNDFEEGIFVLYPRLAAIKQRLYDLGAVYAAMSGSGSALFGFFKEAPALDDFKDCETWII